jgi:hypothetical protein
VGGLAGPDHPHEINSPESWPPQRGAPAAYEQLLAACYDQLHALRRRLNVIGSTKATTTR